MQTFTTKGATDLLYADDYRSNGCPDVWCLLNESGTIELESTTDSVSSARSFSVLGLKKDLYRKPS